MVYALVTHDFSVGYVSQVGSRATPLFYTIISLWGALEGSIVLWAWMLSLYCLLVILRHRENARELALALEADDEGDGEFRFLGGGDDAEGEQRQLHDPGDQAAGPRHHLLAGQLDGPLHRRLREEGVLIDDGHRLQAPLRRHVDEPL